MEDIKKKRLMITSIAKANANDVCKVIMSLPFEPPPMLTLIIQACTRLVQVNNLATNSASEKQGRATGGVEQEMVRVGELSPSPVGEVSPSPLFCYRYGGERAHFLLL